MARVVKEVEHTAKSNEILDAVQRLIFSVGYERMTIRDILDGLQISKGAFYHYFDSKQAVLEAFIERIEAETNKPLLPILHDPHLSAIEKLQGFFDILDNLRMAHKKDVLDLARVWYTDENAVARHKVEQAVRQQRAPLLVEIVRQGIHEGVFTTAYPEQAGDVILSLLQGMGNAHAGLLFSPEPGHDEQHRIGEIIVVYNAYMDAIERTVGVPANSLRRLDTQALRVWLPASDYGAE